MRRDLVLQAMAGDHDAFSGLARDGIGRLYATAMLILRDRQRAEDATQEALVAAWRDLSALRDPDRFDAWLHRLLIRACYREARRERRQWAVELEVRPATGSEPDPALHLADRDAVERAFRHLDVDQRSVIVLHHYVGLTLDEVAGVLGIPPGTVRSRLHRATAAMRAALDADARSQMTTERRFT